MFCLAGAPALADDIPIEITREWLIHNNSGWRYLNRGDYVKAAERFNMAIKEIRPYHPGSSRLLARSYCDLARALYHQGRYAEAEPLAKWALSVREADSSAKPETLFQCVYMLALIEGAEGHYRDAEPLFRRAIALQEKSLGSEHVNLALTLEQLAGVYAEMQRYTQAEALYERVIAIRERSMPAENLDLAETALNYAELLRRMRRPAEAGKWEERAKAIRDRVAEKDRRAKLDRPSAGFEGYK
jgi:tetratricopeptide (TPR) repeat protein